MHILCPNALFFHYYGQWLVLCEVHVEMVTIENTCSLVRAAMTPREKNMEQAFGHDLILVKIASEENTKSLAESLVIRSTASVLGSSVKEAASKTYANDKILL